jgi:hypothetical protein
MLTILHYTYTQASVALDSPTLAADARCSLGCIHLSCILFAGSLLYKLVTAAWFVDPIVAIGKDNSRSECMFETSSPLSNTEAYQ